MKRAVVPILLCLSLFALGAACEKKKMRTEAEVVRISGTLPMIMSSTGAWFGNDSVKLGDPSLVLTLKESNGHIRTLGIVDGANVTKAVILSRICVGTKVSYTTVASGKSAEELALDPYYYAGTVPADDLLVPVPCMDK